MCGIIHVKRFDKKPARKMVYKRYQNQKTRGQEGFGYVSIGDKKIETKRSEKESDIIVSLLVDEASEIMFHHRFPTSTPNIKESTHPIIVDNKTLKYIYYVVHNGIISNDDTLRTKHLAMGFQYTTDVTRFLETRGSTYKEPTIWNDSEALAVELALLLENKQSTIGAVGSIAFVCLQVNRKTKIPEKMFFGRNNGNPLKLDFNDTYISLSSEGSGQNILENYLYCIDYKNPKKIDTEKLNIGTYVSYSGGSGSGYFSDKENDLDEEDFSLIMKQNDKYIELIKEKEKLQKKLEQARTLFDYDKELDIQYQIDLIDDQIDEIAKCKDIDELDEKIDELSDFDSYNNVRRDDLDDF